MGISDVKWSIGFKLTHPYEMAKFNAKLRCIVVLIWITSVDRRDFKGTRQHLNAVKWKSEILSFIGMGSGSIVLYHYTYLWR